MSVVMMILQAATVILFTFVALVGFRLLISTLAKGPRSLRNTIDEGAGLKAFLSGRLSNGQGSTHINEGHGLHFSYDESGNIAFEQKSKVV
jgi:hypothetical protein